MTHAYFARFLCRLADMSSGWAADTLDMAIYAPGSGLKAATVERFLKEARDRLDWLEQELNRPASEEQGAGDAP